MRRQSDRGHVQQRGKNDAGEAACYIAIYARECLQQFVDVGDRLSRDAIPGKRGVILANGCFKIRDRLRIEPDVAAEELYAVTPTKQLATEFGKAVDQIPIGTIVVDPVTR